MLMISLNYFVQLEISDTCDDEGIIDISNNRKLVNNFILGGLLYINRIVEYQIHQFALIRYNKILKDLL